MQMMLKTCKDAAVMMDTGRGFQAFGKIPQLEPKSPIAIRAIIMMRLRQGVWRSGH